MADRSLVPRHQSAYRRRVRFISSGVSRPRERFARPVEKNSIKQKLISSRLVPNKLPALGEQTLSDTQKAAPLVWPFLWGDQIKLVERH
jgi:hypothetical protein